MRKVIGSGWIVLVALTLGLGCDRKRDPQPPEQVQIPKPEQPLPEYSPQSKDRTGLPEKFKVQPVDPALLRERDERVTSINDRAQFLYDHHSWGIVVMPKYPEQVRVSMKEFAWSHLQPTSRKRIRKELNAQVEECRRLLELADQGVSVSGLEIVDKTIEFSRLYLADLDAYEATLKTTEDGAAHSG